MWTAIGLALAADPGAVSGAPQTGTIVIDAKVPVEVKLDADAVGTLLVPSTLTLVTTPGAHTLKMWVHGTASDVPVDVPPDGQVVVVVGSGGVTAGAPPKVAGVGPVRVELRSLGREALAVVIAGTRVVVDAGQTVPVELPAGEHAVTLRNLDGTAMWADGTLVVGAGTLVVVQISDGRAPEVAGAGSAWRPKS
jgi:hypothetical protein